MYNVIASSFFHQKNCVLPGIGTLQLLSHPAESDFHNAQILAPRQEIVFLPSSKDAGIFNEFSALSQIMLQKLAADGELGIAGIGTFHQTPGGIRFSAEDIDADLVQPVSATRVIHKDATHNILVGDHEKTNTEMTDFFNEDEVVPDRWWIAAIVLGVIGAAVVGFYIAQHGLQNFASRSVW